MNPLIKFFALLLLIAVLLVSISYVYNKIHREPPIGNVYIVDWSTSNNPFSGSMPDTLTVLDVKKDYVLYRSARWNQVTSTRLSTFNFLINNRKENQ